jgi:kinesin family protein 3/17/kinesin family protein 11
MALSPGTRYSKRRLDFLPSTTPSPSSKRHHGCGLATEQLVEVIGGETDGDDAEGSCHRGVPSKRRLDSPRIITSKTKRRRAGAGVGAERPVEVIGRIRNLAADGGASALEVCGGGTSVRVRHGTDDGGSCRDFSLDGVSVSEEEGLEAFYRRFVRSRVQGVCLGAKCTVMVYGPTGSGKSHTMFGSAEQPGVVYRALRDILEGGHGGGGGGEDDAGEYVRVSVMEIYNEKVYDLLAASGGNAI